MKILIYACYLIGFCQGNFNLELSKHLNFESKIEFSKEYVNNQEIKDPPGTWIKIISTPKVCLFYKTPYKKNLGILKLAEIKNSKCDEIEDTSFMKDKIESLSVEYDKKKLEIHLNMNQEKMTLSLLGIKKMGDFRKYSSNIEEYKIPSLTLNEIVLRNYIEDGKLCHGVNSNCNSIVENTCDNCKSGFHEVVDYNCPQGGSKYCGQIECGQKDLPACPRGYEVLDTKLSSLCFDGSPAGNCAPGLKTFCNDDKILICI